jgi:hypothetical protein
MIHGEDLGFASQNQKRGVSAYFSGLAEFEFRLRSVRSLSRPKARLLVKRSSREMKCTGTPKKLLATFFCYASENSTAVISVRILTRTGATPIW